MKWWSGSSWSDREDEFRVQTEGSMCCEAFGSWAGELLLVLIGGHEQICSPHRFKEQCRSEWSKQRGEQTLHVKKEIWNLTAFANIAGHEG